LRGALTAEVVGIHCGGEGQLSIGAQAVDERKANLAFRVRLELEGRDRVGSVLSGDGQSRSLRGVVQIGIEVSSNGNRGVDSMEILDSGSVFSLPSLFLNLP